MTGTLSPAPLWKALLTAAAVALAAVPATALAVVCPPGVLPAVSTLPTSLDPQTALTVDYATPILDAKSLRKYVTPVPNALAPAFVYTPTGVQGGETLYQVSMREIAQSVGLIYQNPLNPADPNNGCTAAPAVLWTYGDARDNGITIAPTAPHSFPGPTFETTSNVPLRVIWTNELPAANPYNHPGKIDPTLDCGPNAPGCTPYNRVVPHMHGAHVADDSDGNPDQWFTPGFIKTGHDWQPNTHIPGATIGTYRYENTQEGGTTWYHDHAMGLTHLNVYAALAGFHIIRDANEVALQAPAGAAPAVLPKYPYENLLVIQDRVFDLTGQLNNPDKPIQNFTATLTNAPCDPLLPITAVAPATVSPYACAGVNLVGGVGTVLVPTTPCDPLAVAPSPYVCPVQMFTTNPDGSVTMVPAGTVGATTFPSITPEFFGNVILVNGQAWPKQDVEPRVYRLRFLNGSDSRTYVLRFIDAATKLPVVLDMWQIGTDQGLMNAPVLQMIPDPTVTTVAPCPVGSPVGLVCYSPAGTLTNAVVLMAGERVDLLVDFKKVPAGTTSLILQNIGPDFPYTGAYPPIPDQIVGGVLVPGNGQMPSVIVPEIMQFNVVLPLNAAIPDTLDPLLIGTAGQRALRTPIAPLTPTVGTPVRKLYLAERADRFGRLSLTINGVEYGAMINDFIKLNDVEEWEMYNLTPDGHPMHLHLVGFQVINRQDLIDPLTNLPFAPPLAPPPLGTAVNPAIVGLSAAPTAITPPAANEAGAWKDTIIVPPGKVTRIRAKFDIPGLYVYHCHILSHEENDMMRPMAVTTPAASVTLAASTLSHVAGAATPITFTAAAKTGLGVVAPAVLPYSDSNAYEYQFLVTAAPPGVTTTNPDNLTLMFPGTAPGYAMARTATWTPPIVPGNYTITVNARAMGAPAATPSVTTAVTVTVTPPPTTVVNVTTPPTVYATGTTLTGIAVAGGGKGVSGVTVSVNNGPPVAAVLGAGNTFSAPLTLVAGANTVTVSVTDNGVPPTVSTAISTVTCNPNAPAVALTTPAVVNTAAANIDGTATAVGVNTIGSVKVSLNNGQPVLATVGAGGVFTAPVMLAQGTNTVTVTATDTAVPPNVRIFTSAITYDPAATLVAVTTPAVVNAAAASITGTAIPPAGKAVVSVTVSVNNRPAVAAVVGAGGAFTAPVTLVAGANTITVTSTDNAVPPVATTATSIVTFTAATTVITITAPTLVNVAANTVTGTLAPPAGATVASVTVSVNNGAPVVATVTGTTFTAPVTLVAGANTVTVTATDTAVPPNTSTATSTITYSPTATVITVTTPPLLNKKTANVDGKLQAPGLNKVQTVKVKVNGGPPAFAPFRASEDSAAGSAATGGSSAAVFATLAAPGTFTAPVTLADGVNTVTITVTDNAVPPNVSVATYSINIDQAATVITLTTPAVVNTATTPITGTLVPGTNPVLGVTVNGVAATVTGNTFTAAVPLLEEENLLTIVATDTTGQTTTLTDSVTLEPEVFLITASAGQGGTISPFDLVTVDKGENETFTITPEPGYSVRKVLVDGKSVGKKLAYTFKKVKANHTIDASFALNTFRVATSKSGKGTITPSAVVNYGATQSVVITAIPGRTITKIMVDKVLVPGPYTSPYTYTFPQVTANHKVTATFK